MKRLTFIRYRRMRYHVAERAILARPDQISNMLRGSIVRDMVRGIIVRIPDAQV